MLTLVRNLVDHRELMTILAWKNIAVRYKQAYLGIAWAILKPLMLMFIFTIVRSFIGIDSGGVPYPILTFSALLIWTFFQESASEGVNSVVSNAPLIRKIYFPREVFPLTAVLTKLVELGINATILAGMMVWYGMVPSVEILWMPLLILYTILVSLTIAFVGGAINVYYRDVGAMLPLVLSLMMYLSPIIYPLKLVQEKLLVHRIAGHSSEALYTLYMLNPLAGIIDAFQRVILKGLPPDWGAMAPGFILILIALPLSYRFFKRAESYFADVI
jgi:lipopolysaccharide transport system permease protein